MVGNQTLVLRTMGLMLGLTVVNAILGLTNNYLSVRAGMGFGADMREALYRKVQSLSFGNLDELETGQLLVRLTSDVNAVHMVVQMFLRILTRAPLLMVGSVALMVATSWRLALVLLVTFPLVGSIILLVFGRGRRLFEEVQRRLDRLNTVMQENLSGVRVVKAFVRTGFEEERFEEANASLTAQFLYIMRMFSVVMPTMQFILNLGMVAVVWLGGIQVLGNGMTVGQVMAFANYLQISAFPMMMMGMMVAQIAHGEASAGRILGVLDAPARVVEPSQPRSMPLQGQVAFENVSFSYDGNGSEPVLQGIDLVAEPGETVAILGATGAGKSSLVHLIPRFYDVTEGRVSLDGVDVRDLSFETIRTQVGVALQEAVLFSGTVRDNIRYGRPDATDEEVIAAAKAAQIHDYISSLADGYDTMVGQRGVNLSGGQKQRMSIARALLMNTRILILDDSTSAVDVETETRIEEALKSLPNAHTRFVIAQRISTVLKADKIVVLDRGRIAAIGTHQQLLASSPIYQEIYESQLGNGVVANGGN